jgi:hypothetical protein
MTSALSQLTNVRWDWRRTQQQAEKEKPPAILSSPFTGLLSVTSV